MKKLLKLNMLLILNLAILSLFNTSLSAKSSEEDYVSLKITTLSLGNNITNVGYQVGEEFVKLVVPNGGVSSEIQYNGPKELKFVTSTQPRKLIGRVVLSEEMKDVLCVFVPKNSEKSEYAIIPVNYTDVDFPKNSYCLFNFTKNPLMGLLNKDQFTMKSYEKHIVKMSDNDNKTKISIAFHRDDKVRPLYRAMWGRDVNNRTLVFLVPRVAGSARINVLKFNQPVKE